MTSAHRERETECERLPSDWHASEKAILMTLLDNVSDVIILADPEGRVRHVSRPISESADGQLAGSYIFDLVENEYGLTKLVRIGRWSFVLIGQGQNEQAGAWYFTLADLLGMILDALGHNVTDIDRVPLVEVENSTGGIISPHSLDVAGDAVYLAIFCKEHQVGHILYLPCRTDI